MFALNNFLNFCLHPQNFPRFNTVMEIALVIGFKKILNDKMHCTELRTARTNREIFISQNILATNNFCGRFDLPFDLYSEIGKNCRLQT